MDGGATLDMFHAPRLDAHDRLVEGIIHKASLATKPAPTSTLAGIQDKELELLVSYLLSCFSLILAYNYSQCTLLHRLYSNFMAKDASVYR